MTENKNYRKFLDKGEIEYIDLDRIKAALDRISGKNATEGKALLIMMYYSGARPNEVLRIKAKDVKRKGSYVTVRLPSSKNGLPRTIYLQYKQALIKQFYNYAVTVMPEMFLFYHFQNHYVRKRITKKGVKFADEITGKLGYWFNKWFDGDYNPYFLRHNRFSKLSEAGASESELRLLKGCRSSESLNYYIHLSTKTAKNVAKKIT